MDWQFAVARPNQAYSGEIAYIHTREGWLYSGRSHRPLFPASRGLFDYPKGIKAEQMQAKLVNDATLMAVWGRKPEKGLLWYIDRGSQYASDSNLVLLKSYDIRQSMSRKDME